MTMEKNPVTLEEVINHYYDTLVKAMREYCNMHNLYPWEIQIDTEIRDDAQLVINLYFKGAQNNDK